MVKKRKLETAEETPEADPANDKSSDEATDAKLPSEDPLEGPVDEIVELPIEDPSASESEQPNEQIKVETIESGDPVPDPSYVVAENEQPSEQFTEVKIEVETLESGDPVADLSYAAEHHTSDVAACGSERMRDENDPAYLHKLLEPFAKDQLISLLRDAALKHPDLWDSILQTADVDPTHRKVFVHGFSWNTTAESLIEIFSQYGEIEECKAVVDKFTGKSKGYGFILFKHRSSARKALQEPQKKIGNRMAACQLASIGPVPAPPPVAIPVSEYTQRKIYVSNVASDIDPQKIVQFFSQFGEIEEGPLGLDKATGKPKGFCLFVFKSSEGAKKALEEPHKTFEGHVFHCQKAVDGPKSYKQVPFFPKGGRQHAGLHQGFGEFGARRRKIGRGGGMPSFGGTGHLIAPPAAVIGFNQAGIPLNNGGFVMNPANNGAGGFPTQNMMVGPGPSQIHGNFGGPAMGHGGTMPQGYGNMGGA